MRATCQPLTYSTRLSILTCMGSGHNDEDVGDKADGDLGLAAAQLAGRALNAYLREVGRRGGKAGRGASKARPSEAMRRAVMKRWERERRTRAGGSKTQRS